MKKILTVALACMLCLGALAGCNSAKKDSDDAKAIAGADDLKGATVGVQTGTTGDIYVSDTYEAEGTTIERFTKAPDTIVALQKGKIDCIVIDEEVAKKLINGKDDLKILDGDLTSEDYAICLSKSEGDLKTKIDAAIKELKADGTLKSIIGNYIQGDDGKTVDYQYTSPADTQYPNGDLTIATSPDFEPYEYMDGDKIVGLDIDMLQAICDKIGMNLKIDPMDFDSVITAVQSGKDMLGVSGITITEDRKKNVDFSEPYISTSQVIIVKK